METLHKTTTMTPAQLTHLRDLDAHLTTLLDLAAKRTPGEWTARSFNGIHVSADKGHICQVWGCVNDDNENFIAACAGRAEAGWRATKAAIAFIDSLSSVNLSPCNGGSCMVATEAEEYLEALINKQAQDILTAWPLERLTLQPT